MRPGYPRAVRVGLVKRWRWTRGTECRGQEAPLRADDGDQDFPLAGVIQLDHEDALVLPELQLAVDDGDRLAAAQHEVREEFEKAIRRRMDRRGDEGNLPKSP